MTGSKTARFGPALGVVMPMLLAAALMPAAPALADPAHTITVYNGINFDVTRLKLRKGTVTGFQTLPPGYGVVVGVEMDDGGCGGWLVARTTQNAAAQALIDICSGGTFVVSVNARQNGYGTALDLHIKRVE